MWLKILLGLAAILIIFIIVVATRPSTFRVERSALVSAPPEAVFAEVNDFHRWEAWNPWGKLDPAMKQSYEGPAAGAGAKYAWVGNNNVGEGSMTILESKPNDLVRIQLDFLKPFAGTSLSEFTFRPEGAGTKVTWAMSGKNNFIAKVLCLFMSTDKMIGGQFEKGLADLKSIAEKKSPQ
ncbi:MAG TPA: SRPBCC family protein [bacterium]|nr:SRPBCC family protein [bacterium]